MENLQLFIVLFFLVFPCIPSQQCSLKVDCDICGGEENGLSMCKHTKECYTGICSNLDGGLKGWQYSCLDLCESYLSQKPFQVTYVADTSVTFECGEYEPNLQSLFHQVNLSGIKAFSFKSCSIPSTSYSDIIPYQEPVEYLKIELLRPNGTLRSEMFGNISSTLKNLILSENNIDVLPETMFSDFTNLKYLSLTDNKLKELPQNIFNNTTSLINLEIMNNLLESLPEQVFQNLNNLERLYLNINKLKELPSAIFRNLNNLQVLELNNNHLMELPVGVFSGLSSMISIRLSSNLLKPLSNDLFSYSTNLKDIDLGSNFFMKSLPENLLTNLTLLETITISSCNLSQIHENFFVNCPNLKKVILKRNNLTSLPKSLFKNNLMLKEVNLDSNFLNSKLPNTLFPNQMQLEKFSISKNNLSFVPEGFFQRTRKLKSLDMSKNRIQNANQSLFGDLPNLEFLYLQGNNLTYFEFNEGEFIKQIDLSFNNLKKVPIRGTHWQRHLRLELLNLNHNKISYVSVPVLYSTKKRNPELKLAYNNIRTVSTQVISEQDEIIKVYYLEDIAQPDVEDIAQLDVELLSNPFTCDCNLYGFYKYVQSSSLRKRSARFGSAQSLTCQEPNSLTGKKVMSLSPKQFICEIQENCPYPCECYYRIHDDSNVLNCSYRGLTLLPTLIPHNINVFLFQGNSLVDIKDLNEENWKNLTELYLDNNQIRNLYNWQLPVNLKNLSLIGNNISYVPHSFMNSILNHRKLQLSMGSNPLNCNCSAFELKKWLAEQSHNITDVNEIMCANHVNINGTLVRSIILTTPDNILCPNDDSPYKLHLIFVTVTCVILACLLVLVSALYYRNKQTVIAYVYIHMHQVFTCFFSEEDLDEDKMFDAFLSYSTSDRDIALLIREELEEKDPHFRVCIHERNWIAGNPISWNIFNSVQNSKRTILLISKEFLESMWFQVEFHTAYYQMLEDKIDRLIIIVKGQLPPKETMDKDLQYLLTTKTYLLWEEKWFWEKLKYALPHKRHQLVPNDVLALKDRPASEKVKSIETQIAILSNGDTKSSEKLQEVIQNHTNSTMNLVNKDSSKKK